ncbi:hypothetical protein RJ639_034211 [Escallonia herrerae]|uniref:Uncharacterized protein n=1 Tax=Escallonia herrerae TaxID=1293975 RepID=A0AA88WVQ1_9ASTE|nr:hypothetical protein RJ639_034211 [Escallonia herrerae]
MKKRRAEEQRLKSARGREKSSDDIFVCERVCTSKRMLKKVGVFSKDPTPDTCVTVCGVSELDACADACARTVCVNQHQVPNWNDICLKRYLSTSNDVVLISTTNILLEAGGSTFELVLITEMSEDENYKQQMHDVAVETANENTKFSGQEAWAGNVM